MIEGILLYEMSALRRQFGRALSGGELAGARA